MILAIDPGSVKSGFVLFDGSKVHDSGVAENHDVRAMLQDWSRPGECALAIEMMKARGMPTSNEEMETLVWIGRFIESWYDPHSVRLVYRADVKLHVCGTAKATDSNIRAGLIEMVGPQGKKASPGPTYGVASHSWAALAVAVTALSQMKAAA
jgi:hypothetical protein